MYLLNDIMHNVHIQCHKNYIEVKKTNYLLEIDILIDSVQTILGALKGDFEGLCVQMTPRRPAG